MPAADEDPAREHDVLHRQQRDGGQVSQMSGFRDSVILDHVFCHEVGMSPGAYRKRQLRA